VRLVPPSASLLDYTFKVETKNTNKNIKHVLFIISVQLMPQGYERNKPDRNVMRLHVLITVNTRLWSSFQNFEVVQSTPLLFWDVALHHRVIAANVQVSAVASSSRATCPMPSDISHLKMWPLHGVATQGNEYPVPGKRGQYPSRTKISKLWSPGRRCCTVWSKNLLF
jgi:hypothetical protein